MEWTGPDGDDDGVRAGRPGSVWPVVVLVVAADAVAVLGTLWLYLT